MKLQFCKIGNLIFHTPWHLHKENKQDYRAKKKWQIEKLKKCKQIKKFVIFKGKPTIFTFIHELFDFNNDILKF